MCEKNLNCNLMNWHSAWNNPQTEGWDSTSLTCEAFLWFFSLQEYIWLSPNKPELPLCNFRWTTRCKKGHLHYSLLDLLHPLPSPAYTLLRYSVWVLPWLSFCQNIPSKGTSKPQKGKTLQATTDCGSHYQSWRENERERETRKTKREEENLADAHS